MVFWTNCETDLGKHFTYYLILLLPYCNKGGVRGLGEGKCFDGALSPWWLVSIQTPYLFSNSKNLGVLSLAYG